MSFTCEECRNWLSELLEAESASLSSPTSPSAPVAPLSPPSPVEVPAGLFRLSGGMRERSHGNGIQSHSLPRASLEEHLASCAECSLQLAQLRQLRASLRAQPLLAAPPELRSRVLQAIAADQGRAPEAEERLALAAAPVAVFEPAPEMAAPPSPPVSLPAGRYHEWDRSVSLLENLRGVFASPRNLTWAGGLALTVFCLFMLARHDMMSPQDAETSSPATASRDSVGGDNKTKVADAKTQPEHSAAGAPSAGDTAVTTQSPSTSPASRVAKAMPGRDRLTVAPPPTVAAGRQQASGERMRIASRPPDTSFWPRAVREPRPGSAPAPIRMASPAIALPKADVAPLKVSAPRTAMRAFKSIAVPAASSMRAADSSLRESPTTSAMRQMPAADDRATGVGGMLLAKRSAPTRSEMESHGDSDDLRNSARRPDIAKDAAIDKLDAEKPRGELTKSGGADESMNDASEPAAGVLEAGRVQRDRQVLLNGTFAALPREVTHSLRGGFKGGARRLEDDSTPLVQLVFLPESTLVNAARARQDTLQSNYAITNYEITPETLEGAVGNSFNSDLGMTDSQSAGMSRTAGVRVAAKTSPQSPLQPAAEEYKQAAGTPLPDAVPTGRTGAAGPSGPAGATPPASPAPPATTLADSSAGYRDSAPPALYSQTESRPGAKIAGAKGDKGDPSPANSERYDKSYSRVGANPFMEDSWNSSRQGMFQDRSSIGGLPSDRVNALPKPGKSEAGSSRRSPNTQGGGMGGFSGGAGNRDSGGFRESFEYQTQKKKADLIPPPGASYQVNQRNKSTAYQEVGAANQSYPTPALTERRAILFVVPPYDTPDARIDVTLTPGLRLEGSDKEGVQTVWRGSARENETIKIPITLVATEAGAQAVTVTLNENTTQVYQRGVAVNVGISANQSLKQR